MNIYPVLLSALVYFYILIGVLAFFSLFVFRHGLIPSWFNSANFMLSSYPITLLVGTFFVLNAVWFIYQHSWKMVGFVALGILGAAFSWLLSVQTA
jgi:hypothetical protein